MKYKIYLHNLLNETVEESGDVINPNPNNRVLNESPRDLRIRQNLAVDEEESKVEGSYLHSDINNANSQHIITQNMRHDTYKSLDTGRDRNEDRKHDNLESIMNIYKKKKISIAMLPAVFHVITKKDMLSEQGFEDQLSRAKSLKDQNIIDEFFFISSKDQDGIMDFLEGINERRLDLLKQEQDVKDIIRHENEISIQN